MTDKRDPDGEELLRFDHTDDSFTADADVVEEPEINITESDGPNLEEGDDLDTGAGLHRERD